jgi:predicted LPLAT superfamily acyltransferase
VSGPAFLRRFLVRGVFWRQFLRWAVLNVPLWLEPVVMAAWSAFFLLWGPGRRGVMRNLAVIKPRSWAVTNFFRCYRVFWNYAWTITDNVRFKEERVMPDWEFSGGEHFDEMEQRAGGAILLTAHMGSYDLGAHLFSVLSHRQIVMVRAPEIDPQTREFEEKQLAAGLRVEFNTNAANLAIELLDAVRGEVIVAVQGDRVTPGISDFPATMFGRAVRIPSGPFALAMTARVPIYPVFVIRLGRRRYRLLTGGAIELVRTSRNRDDDLRRAIDAWSQELERVIAAGWYQWFTFEPFFEEQAA